MELNITSNRFNNNKAKNGAALYFGKEQNNDIQYENKTMIIENNDFYKNSAQMFGGAIYSEYNKISLAKIKNNKIRFNTADIMGGGIYTTDFYGNKTININGFIFENNTVSLKDDHYTTKPTYVSLNTTLSDNLKNINVGDYFPLTFSLCDEFGNAIPDVTKYYSMITLKLKIKLNSDNSKMNIINNINNSNSSISGDNYNNFKVNNNSDIYNGNNNNNNYLLGNICTFIQGKKYIYISFYNYKNL